MDKNDQAAVSSEKLPEWPKITPGDMPLSAFLVFPMDPRMRKMCEQEIARADAAMARLHAAMKVLDTISMGGPSDRPLTADHMSGMALAVRRVIGPLPPLPPPRGEEERCSTY